MQKVFTKFKSLNTRDKDRALWLARSLRTIALGGCNMKYFLVPLKGQAHAGEAPFPVFSLP
jgi:hypothetical protein